jgi:hypothetical protein
MVAIPFLPAHNSAELCRNSGKRRGWALDLKTQGNLLQKSRLGPWRPIPQFLDALASVTDASIAGSAKSRPYPRRLRNWSERTRMKSLKMKVPMAKLYWPDPCVRSQTSQKTNWRRNVLSQVVVQRHPGLSPNFIESTL